MATVVCINGELCGEADATVSVFDRGFLYGDSVFEVMRTYSGVPFAEREHLERLARSCRRVRIPLPVSLEEFSTEIHSTLQQAQNEDSYIRVIVTRGSGPLKLDPELVDLLAPLELRQRGDQERSARPALMQLTKPALTRAEPIGGSVAQIGPLGALIVQPVQERAGIILGLERVLDQGQQLGRLLSDEVLYDGAQLGRRVGSAPIDRHQQRDYVRLLRRVRFGASP